MSGAGRARIGILLALLMCLVSPVCAADYVIQPGDVLDISVLGEQALSGPATVTPDGKLVLQMAGEIPAAGRTLSQLTAIITAELRQFVRDPQVTVSIRSPRRQFAYALGRVARPGAYEIDRGWTISQLVAQAGGPASDAALARTVVMRGSETIPVDLEKLIVGGNASANFTLQADDVMLVPEISERILVMGQVAKPGAYPFKAGERVVDVLGTAGGLAANASPNEVGVIRPKAGQQSVVTRLDLSKFYKNADASQNMVLQPGDIVYVPDKGVDWLSILNPLTTLLLLFHI